MNDTAQANTPTPAKAYFAGGCFWCMESEFQTKKGVLSVTSGFVGGAEEKTYAEISKGNTGYVEAVEVVYDPAMVTYPQLLDIYWGNIDPTDSAGQFYDRGTQYQTVIYTQNPAEQIVAEGSKRAMAVKLGKLIATQIEPMGHFHAAEAYHQDYFEKNKDAYERYVKGSGRKEKLKEIWGQSQ